MIQCLKIVLCIITVVCAMGPNLSNIQATENRYWWTISLRIDVDWNCVSGRLFHWHATGVSN